MLGLFDFPGRITLKIRNRYRFNRLWLSLAAILLGILAGYFVGRQSILHAVKARLGEYADRILERDEEVSTEIQQVLRQADASTYPSCSDEDLLFMHRLARRRDRLSRPTRRHCAGQGRRDPRRRRLGRCDLSHQL